MSEEDSKKPKTEFREVTFYQDIDNIIEIVYDKDLVPEIQFAVYNLFDKDVSYHPELQLENGIILKPSSLSIIRDGKILFPEYADEYIDEERLISDIEKFVYKYLDLPHPFYLKLVSHYILLTWVFDKFTVIPYLRALGDYGSGKTRFAQVIGSVSYRPLFMAGATSDAFIFRMIELFKGTLIINELERINTDLNNQITIILNNGYEAGLAVGRVEGDKKKEPKLFDVFSPKIITSRNKFKDQALESRILSIPLKPTKRTDIPSLLDLTFWEEATSIRNKLLFYRFRNLRMPDLENKTEKIAKKLASVEPRLRQTLIPLLNVVSSEQVEAEFIKYAKEFQEQIYTDRSFETEALIAERLLQLFESKDKVTVKDVADQVNQELDLKLQLTSKAVGSKIRSFGFKTKRIQGVYQIEPNLKVIEYITERYGFNRSSDTTDQSPPNPQTPPSISTSTGEAVDLGDIATSTQSLTQTEISYTEEVAA